MAVDRRLLALGATAVGLLIAVMVARSGNETVPPTATARTRAANRTAPATDAAPAEVQLAALSRARGEPQDANRNPFRFRPKPAPPPPPPTGKPPESTFLVPPVPAGPPPPPPPPPITLKFIGIVEKADGTRIAVLSDGKQPISGREGQEIDGRYKILKIGTESLEISYIDGRGRQTLPLSGQ